MKKILYILLFLNLSLSLAQEDARIKSIKNKLEILSTTTPELTENVKTEINVNNITLSNFLLAVSSVHNININVSTPLNQISITNNFTNVTVIDLLVFLCKEYKLTIDFTGNILSVKKFTKTLKKPDKRTIPIVYNPKNNFISIDAKNDTLYVVFKKIMEKTGKSLVFSPELANKTITAFIQQTPFDSAMDKLAFSNNLHLEQSNDGFFVFKNNLQSNSLNANNNLNRLVRPLKRKQSSFYFNIIDLEEQLIEVNFSNTPIADIINEIGAALNINIFTATPLELAGNATFRTANISFENLLIKLFESDKINDINAENTRIRQATNQSTLNNINSISQPSDGLNFSFKKEQNVYYFGLEKQLSVRAAEIIYLKHRSVELLSDPHINNSSINNFNNGINRNFRTDDFRTNNNLNTQFQNHNQNAITSRSQISNFNSQNQNTKTETKDLLTIIPEELKDGLDFTTDYELNSFYVTGPSAKIQRFKAFLKQIDKSVPVVLIEVMIIEVNRNTTTDTGIEWGIGESPMATQGGLFPNTDITLSSKTINKIIGGFGDFAGFNLGKVIPNFFAKIKLMESNGNFKILSTPKLATLNGHRATFSNGQTSYYTVTNRSIIGSDNPITNEIVNYLPIEAELGLTIKPSVTGKGDILLDINVIQSNFGTRIDANAPPDINSRTFSSIIRLHDQDIAILGGLEENSKNDSGSGVPFLARIPVIKYLFSRRTRTAKKSKLTVLIKPTIVY